MTREVKYDKVNQCETLQELADTIRSFGVDGIIEGRTRSFPAEQMAKACEDFKNVTPNHLTREFGIRQQAMYIIHYRSN